MKTLLVDADFMAFTIASACQETIAWDDDIITTHIDMRKAQDVFASTIADVTTACDPFGDGVATVVLAWSDPARRYFRHVINPSYKGNRKSTAPPLGLSALRKWANEQWVNIWLPGLEGDDVLGILATGDQLLSDLYGRELYRTEYGLRINQQRIIVGVDKDLRQITGVHFNPNKPEEGLVTVTPLEGKRLLSLQTLMGDATDGYTGIPGVGAVKATRMIDTWDLTQPTWPLIVAAYEAAKLTEADAAVQFNMARILTRSSYDFKKQEPILWNPSATTGLTTEKAA